ncbi:hypothetical protein DSO57_1030870 [Entomophthora muscae]|uniref:Uncharacterized protein n=1 Tax=Entomophthora muscae TaxID=34485 RepID=A0ACC2T0T0_9FUNG|nr:hypothetical protein DSO57_1030870 [Entomophthora muscae]
MPTVPINSTLAQEQGLQEGPSAWITLANKSRIQVTRIKGNPGVKVGENHFDIKVSSLSNLAFPLILSLPWAIAAKAVLNLDSMKLSTQKNGFPSTIPFNHTGHEGILTPEDTVKVMDVLEEVNQIQIYSKLQDLAEAFSESSCS